MFPPGGYYSGFPRIRIRDGNLITVYKPYLFKKKITKKMWCICTMARYSAIKKNKIMPFAVTSDTERQTSYDTAYMWNLKVGYK